MKLKIKLLKDKNNFNIIKIFLIIDVYLNKNISKYHFLFLKKTRRRKGDPFYIWKKT